MPVLYEYNGTTFSFPEGTTKEQALAFIASKTPHKTTIGEDVAIGLANTGHMLQSGIEGAAGGVTSLFSEAEGDRIFKQMEDRQAKRDAEMQQYDQGFGGKVVSGLAGIAPVIGASALTGGAALAPLLGAQFGAGALEAGMRDVKEAREEGKDVNTLGVIGKTMGDVGLNMAAAYLPMGKGVVSGALWGAGGNVAADMAVDTLGRYMTEGVEASQRRYEYDLEKYGVSAAVGGILGGYVGTVNGKHSAELKKIKDTIDSLIPWDAKEPIEIAQRNLEITQRNMDEQMDSLMDLKKGLEGMMADPSNVMRRLVQKARREGDNDSDGKTLFLKLKEKLEGSIAAKEIKIEEMAKRIADYDEFLNLDKPEPPKKGVASDKGEQEVKLHHDSVKEESRNLAKEKVLAPDKPLYDTNAPFEQRVASYVKKIQEGWAKGEGTAVKTMDDIIVEQWLHLQRKFQKRGLSREELIMMVSLENKMPAHEVGKRDTPSPADRLPKNSAVAENHATREASKVMDMIEQKNALQKRFADAVRQFEKNREDPYLRQQLTNIHNKLSVLEANIESFRVSEKVNPEDAAQAALEKASVYDKIRMTENLEFTNILAEKGLVAGLEFLADPAKFLGWAGDAFNQGIFNHKIYANAQALSKVAQMILENPHLRPEMKLWHELTPEEQAYMKQREAAGLYFDFSGTFHLSEKGGRVPEVFLHEILHHATTKMIRAVEEVLAKQAAPDTISKELRDYVDTLPKGVVSAITQLGFLRKSVARVLMETDHKLYATFQEQLRNTHEFVSYALTDPKFQSVLADLNLKRNARQDEGIWFPQDSVVPKGHQSVFKTIVETLVRLIRSAFKTTDKLDTVLQQVLINSEWIVLHSKGELDDPNLPASQRWGFNRTDLVHGGVENSAESMRKFREGKDEVMAAIVRDHEHIAQDPVSLQDVKQDALGVNDITLYQSKSFVSQWFGKQQFGEMVRGNPILRQMLRGMRFAEAKAQSAKAFFMFGDTPPSQISKFKHLMGMDSWRGSIPWLVKSENVPLNDWIEVTRLAIDAGWRKIDHQDQLNNASHLTPSQKYLYENLIKAWDRMYKYQRSLEIQLGLPKGALVKYFKGWHPLVHKGDYEVLASYKSALFYHQTLRTKAEAQALIAKMKQDPAWKNLDIKLEDLSSLKFHKASNIDKIRSQLDLLERQKMAGIISQLDYAKEKRRIEIMMKNAGIGGHNLARVGIMGAEGTKLYQSPLDAAREFRQAQVDYADEMKTHITKRFTSRIADELLLDPELQKSHPNTLSLVQVLKELQTNEYQRGIEFVDIGLRNFIDSAAIKAVHMLGFKDWYPKTHVRDKAFGIATQLFYISALTLRPGFWIAQVLSSPQAVRQLFRHGDITDGLTSLGKGMMQVFSGGDVEFNKAVRWIIKNKETFHPQFINEINNFEFFVSQGSMLGETKAGTALRRIVPWMTGNKMAGAADAISRYMAFAMFYEHHKAQGRVGEELYSAAAHDTDLTMVMYNNQNRAPVIRRFGFVGDLVAPMQTFATAQLGNLVADYKHMISQKGLGGKLKGSAPLVATALVTILMGGMMGMVGIAEYEALRRLLIWADPEIGTWMPSIFDEINQDEAMEWGTEKGLPRGSISYGLPSAVMGFDVGSGLRWNPIISRTLTGDASLLSLFPSVNFAVDVVDAVVTGGKYLAGSVDVTASEARTKTAKLIPIVGAKALVDETVWGAGGREMVPGGARGYGQREQTDKERFSTLLGSATMEAAHDRQVQTILKSKEDLRSKRRQKAIDAILDAQEEGDFDKEERARERLFDMGLTTKEIREQLKTAKARRGQTAEERFFEDSRGRVRSKEARRKRELSEIYRGY